MKRRGFLSLCLSLPLIVRVPRLSQPILDMTDKVLKDRVIKNLSRYVLGDSALVESVRTFQFFTDRIFRPERLRLSNTAFDILHLSIRGEPLMGNAVDAALFSPLGFSQRLLFTLVAPGDQIVIAVRNRTPSPVQLNLSLIGSVLET